MNILGLLARPLVFLFFGLILGASVLTFSPSPAFAYVEYKCSVTYTNGCQRTDAPVDNKEEEKNVDLMPEEKAIAYRPNPYKHLLEGKELPPGFEMDHLGYPTYFTPDAPVEFREMVKNPTEINVRAYINSMSYQAARNERINELIKEVGAKIREENIAKLERDLKTSAPGVVMLVFLRAIGAPSQQSEKVLKAIKTVREKVGAVKIKYYFSDPVATLDEQKDSFSSYKSVRDFVVKNKISSPLLVEEATVKKKMGLNWVPAIIVVERKSGAMTKVMGYESEQAISDQVLGFLKMIARYSKAAKEIKKVSSSVANSTRGSVGNIVTEVR